MDKKTCFIITPIGEQGSDTFRKASGVIESVIKPVLESYNYGDIKVAHEIAESGMISTQIINRIVDADLVIANLTDKNPNVMYELCLRHIVAKPIIHICEEGTVLPFDIKDNRTIFYKNDMMGTDELSKKLNIFIKSISYEDEYRDNPIYTALQYNSLLKYNGSSEESEKNKLLLSILDGIEEIKHDVREQEWGIRLATTVVNKYRIDTRKVDMTTIDWEMVDELLKEQPIINPTLQTLASGLRISPDLLVVISIASGLCDVDMEYVFNNEALVHVLNFIKRNQYAFIKKE